LKIRNSKTTNSLPYLDKSLLLCKSEIRRLVFIQNPGDLIQTCVFFLLFFIFVWLWIDPTIIYHGHGHSVIYPICTSKINIFTDYPPFPGKTTMYMAARLSHYYYFSWAGAMIITIIAWLLSVGTDKFITTISGRRLPWLRFVPAVFLLAQHSRYYPFLLAENLSLLFVLFFLYLYIRIPLQFVWFRFICLTIFAALIYAAAAQMFLVFVLLAAIFEIFNNRRWAVGFSCFFLVLIIPYLTNTFVFDLNLSEAYHRILPFPLQLNMKEKILAYGFFSFLPIAGFGCGIWRLFAEKHKPEKSRSRKKLKLPKSCREPRKHFSMLAAVRQKKIKWLLETLALFVVTSGLIWLTYDPVARINQRIDYFSRHKMWDELLQQSRKSLGHSYDMFICHDVDRALYHTHRLLEDMFLYPQHYAGLLLTQNESFPKKLLVQTYVKSSNTLYELGHINEAENASYEALSTLGYYPEGLMRLALINIIKGQTDAARTFLYALGRDFLYEDIAKQYLQRLETDPLLSKDEQIRRLRSFMLVDDGINKTTPKDLFEKNKHNRMAFEYLMAFLLLTGQHNAVADSIGYLDNFDYPRNRIPRHLEEAVLLYMTMTKRKVDPHGRQINTATIRRFQKFWQLFQRHKRDLKNPAKELEKEFGDTYYYFYFFLLNASE